MLLGETSSVDTAGFSPRSLAAFAYLVVFGSIVAFSAFAWLVRSTAPTVVATYAYVNPLVAVGLGAALGGETLDGRMVLGGAVVVASVAAVTMGRSRPAPAPSVADEVADGVPSA